MKIADIKSTARRLKRIRGQIVAQNQALSEQTRNKPARGEVIPLHPERVAR